MVKNTEKYGYERRIKELEEDNERYKRIIDYFLEQEGV